MNLNREAIVKAGLYILDAYGLQDVSMRRIASTLDVGPSALYWHFASKQDLLGAMAEVILEELPQFPGHDLSRLPIWAARFHALLMRHPSGAELVWSVVCLQDWHKGVGFLIEQGLVESGVDPSIVRGAAHGLLHLVLGQAFHEDQRRQGVRLGVLPEETDQDSAKTLDDAIALFLAGVQTYSC